MQLLTALYLKKQKLLMQTKRILSHPNINELNSCRETYRILFQNLLNFYKYAFAHLWHFVYTAYIWLHSDYFCLCCESYSKHHGNLGHFPSALSPQCVSMKLASSLDATKHRAGATSWDTYQHTHIPTEAVPGRLQTCYHTAPFPLNPQTTIQHHAS